MHLLRQAGVPVPRSISVYKTSDLNHVESRLNFPVVLKVSTGTFGNKIVLGVTTLAQLKVEYMKLCPSSCEAFLVEEMAVGEHYRVLAIDGIVVDVVHRRPNWISCEHTDFTFGDCVSRNNHLRSQIGLSSIPVDWEFLRHSKKLYPDTRLAWRHLRKIRLSDDMRRFQGNYLEHVPSSRWHPSLHILARRIFSIGVPTQRMIGFDVIASNISSDIRNFPPPILVHDINSNPDTTISFVAANQPHCPFYVTERILDAMCM
ncbi:hypothetical protein AURANDRAFT_68901 [Aureococcus anophagefferens]|uniref:ATP-grasp domain-containing protein n=1 Tax=Aureococcus anophagefferens TaxID=44056 RepID=F0YR40_AURAN|nr:hypothetical protein AURANDRAFT_68901 [Aureococcus anophagefferens]EGB02420.1 hypothetical protein AURANDRAFT_68901 [Aureococcus anophagefferens]|eukprot:XP_009042882.1 hypothetical protein AURANDRAFT_68901 [Aureococcus anophagefferens]